MAPTQEWHGLEAGGTRAAQRALRAVGANGAANGASTLASSVAAAGGNGCDGAHVDLGIAGSTEAGHGILEGVVARRAGEDAERGRIATTYIDFE